MEIPNYDAVESIRMVNVVEIFYCESRNGSLKFYESLMDKRIRENKTFVWIHVIS